MALVSLSRWVFFEPVGEDDHFPILAFFAVFAVTVVFLSLLWPIIKPTPFPIVDGRAAPDGYLKLIEEAQKIHRIFVLKTYAGPITILPPEYIDEIRNERCLSLAAWIKHEFSTSYATFEVFRSGTEGNDVLQDAARSGLTKAIGSLSPRMSEDVSTYLTEAFQEQPGWREILLNDSIDYIVQRVVVSVIFGTELSSRTDWLEMVTTCLKTGGTALLELRKWPPALRPLIHWWLPSCRRVRDQAHKLRENIEPVIAARRAQQASPKDHGSRSQYQDAFEWMEHSAKERPYDAAMSPMTLFLLGTDTTTDLFTQVLADLSERPELVEAMRQEVMTVMPRQNGWRTQDIHKLRLMDSVVKESQRLKPFEFVLLRRTALETVRLSDGTQIQKGSSIGFSTDFMCDPTMYPNPKQFDAFRFLKMRDMPGHTHKSQLASPSASHVGFGYGLQSCPGRFFAVALVKILLAHIVMGYDLKPPGSAGIETVQDGFRLNTAPTATLLVRRRQGVAVP